MEQNFEKHMLKINSISCLRYVLIENVILRYLPEVFLLSCLNEFIYKSSSGNLYKMCLLIGIKLILCGFIGLIAGKLKYDFYINLTKKQYTLNDIKTKYIVIKGIITWGFILSICSITYPINICTIIFNVFIYMITGVLFGASIFQVTKPILKKYSK
ncbi:hypothetical protein C3495_13830 (plasmid) [Clostridiaceae bacterium 14S0207]|nr:hypothetical protein C3495_13830 [Clostridiaceae bacterium 14S0207]